MPVTWMMGDSHLKAHLHLSVEAEVFIRRERKTEQRDQGRGVKSPLYADKHSPFQKGKWQSGVRHPGLVIRAPQLKVCKSPRAVMPEGWSLYLLKLLPRILVQTCCSSTSHILAWVPSYRNIVKRMVGGLQFPTVRIFHSYRSPLKIQEQLSH